MDVQQSASVALGSDLWLGASEYEPGSVFHVRATKFLASVKWDVLAGIASKLRDDIPCRLEDKFSVGHFNMVRRINFDDGVSWVVRLRLPDIDMFKGREVLTSSKAMEIEIASMKFFRSKTSIPVPKVWEYSTTHSNAVGAPYILMDYIHGTVATELRRARSCPLQMFGTPEQDQRFREQMAEIQATVASFRFAQIGSLYHNPATDEFYIGPELQTGRGPWGSSTEYYDDLVNHLLHSASAKDELKQSQSFMLPSILGHLIRIHGEEKTGPFRLTNRDFGAHNILVVSQYPTLSFLDTEPPGVVPTKPAAIERVKCTAPRLQQYKELLGKAEAEKGDRGKKVADRLGSISASIYGGMTQYASHQDFVNEKWMKSCLKMLVDYAQETD